MNKKQRGSVRLYKNKTQHLVCAARINGVSAKLLIDTGASSSCLNIAFQKQFALEIEGQPFEAAGAGEGKMQAIFSKACHLHLGRFKTGKHAFVLLDMHHINRTLKAQKAAPIEGILGADFFFNRKAQIDYQQRLLFFDCL